MENFTEKYLFLTIETLTHPGGYEGRKEKKKMVAYSVIDEKFTTDYYINAAKMYEHYSDETKYFASVTSLVNLEEIKCVECVSEKEAIAAFKTLIDLYDKEVIK